MTPFLFWFEAADEMADIIYLKRFSNRQALKSAGFFGV
jgi:hypothetical protein